MSEVLLDRNIKPISHGVGEIPFTFPEKYNLKNSADLFVYRDQDSEVLRIDFLFKAGTSHSKNRLESVFTNNMIASGTSTLTEREISEKIDFYGAYFEKHVDVDEASFTVYSLKKYVVEVLKIVAEVLSDPIFPLHELDTIRNIKKQKFLVNCEKVSFLTRREFANSLFGKDHPYGGKTEIDDFDKLTREGLISYHDRYYKENPTILISGNVEESLIQLVDELFGASSGSNGRQDLNVLTPEKNTSRVLLNKKDAVQSAIRIGRLMFNRTHEDFPEMQVLNTVLGGYFGSRLMSNLREDKGFTYGVGSGVASMIHEGYFFISTEVGAESTFQAEEEIKKELRLLREELIPQDELNLVKNYLLGQILKSTDGVFARMNRFKTLHLFGQSTDDFQSVISGIRNVSSERLRELANQWFQEEDMLTVISGKTS